MSKELGPCLLCCEGGQPRTNNEVACGCGLFANFEIWTHLSAIAANERRMREALERCRKWLRQWNHEHDETELESPMLLESLCDEALKGGKG